MDFLKVSQIRDLFLDYFKKREHVFVSSSSLLPKSDASLLFTTAGMVQFKSLFTGNVELPYLRAVSYQKCLRTTDLEQVGKTDRHCTFFEMLGNFSFGDYFKKEAIEYALEFSVDYLKFPKDKIWISVYFEDDESFKIWESLGFKKEKIVRLGKEDNFWGPAGETGACGPCSELYFDRGLEKGCKKSTCKPGCDCDRFIEYWNIVFNQYYQDYEKNFQPLKQTGIDTGAGLERLAALIQGVDSVYETDELRKIISKIEDLSGVVYGDKNKSYFRVIADHIRATSFSIADSIYPDRVGRGYVIRRLIRRALLSCKKLGIKGEFLYLLCDCIEEIYSKNFLEIKQNIKTIREIILTEEKLFLNTLDLGLEKLNEIVESLENETKVFSGKHAFLLYGTYGFPLEVTEEILADLGFSVNKEEFYEQLKLDKENSRNSWQNKTVQFLHNFNEETKFVGYKQEKHYTSIQKILLEHQDVDSLTEGQKGILILKESPFYPESGGQKGDFGKIHVGGSLFLVKDTQRESNVILHFGKVTKGSFQVGQNVRVGINAGRRKNLRVHHTATHLLNFALRKFLGDHVYQKSSLIEEHYLRFDFSHFQPLLERELENIENFVNEGIAKEIDVSTRELPIEEAKKTGAVAVFDEKYGDIVRVVQIQNRSTEFCGGTHVKNTSEIKLFTIKKESSPGVGVRRIEAVCNKNVISYYQDLFFDLEKNLASLRRDFKRANYEFKDDINLWECDEIDYNLQSGKISSIKLKKDYFQMKEQLSKLRGDFLKLQKNEKKSNLLENEDLINSILDSKKNCLNMQASLYFFSEEENGMLKSLLDILNKKDDSILYIFINQSEKTDNLTILLSCSSKLSAKIHCGNLLKKIVSSFDGKGGGKPNMAQGGFNKKGLLNKDIEEKIFQVL